MQMQEHPVIIFDGVCNLCNGFVQYIIRRDPDANFRFAALQSSFAKQLTLENNARGNEPESVLVWEKGKLYSRSTAVLRIAKRLGGLPSLLYGFIIVPVFIRDGVYRWIARKRYDWFGRTEQCMVPTPELADRFIN